MKRLCATLVVAALVSGCGDSDKAGAPPPAQSAGVSRQAVPTIDPNAILERIKGAGVR